MHNRRHSRRPSFVRSFTLDEVVFALTPYVVLCCPIIRSPNCFAGALLSHPRVIASKTTHAVYQGGRCLNTFRSCILCDLLTLQTHLRFFRIDRAISLAVYQVSSW